MFAATGPRGDSELAYTMRFDRTEVINCDPGFGDHRWRSYRWRFDCRQLGRLWKVRVSRFDDVVEHVSRDNRKDGRHDFTACAHRQAVASYKGS